MTKTVTKERKDGRDLAKLLRSNFGSYELVQNVLTAQCAGCREMAQGMLDELTVDELDELDAQIELIQTQMAQQAQE